MKKMHDRTLTCLCRILMLASFEFTRDALRPPYLLHLVPLHIPLRSRTASGMQAFLALWKKLYFFWTLEIINLLLWRRCLWLIRDPPQLRTKVIIKAHHNCSPHTMKWSSRYKLDIDPRTRYEVRNFAASFRKHTHRILKVAIGRAGAGWVWRAGRPREYPAR